MYMINKSHKLVGSSLSETIPFNGQPPSSPSGVKLHSAWCGVFISHDRENAGVQLVVLRRQGLLWRGWAAGGLNSKAYTRKVHRMVEIKEFGSTMINVMCREDWLGGRIRECESVRGRGSDKTKGGYQESNTSITKTENSKSLSRFQEEKSGERDCFFLQKKPKSTWNQWRRLTVYKLQVLTSTTMKLEIVSNEGKMHPIVSKIDSRNTVVYLSSQIKLMMILVRSCYKNTPNHTYHYELCLAQISLEIQVNYLFQHACHFPCMWFKKSTGITGGDVCCGMLQWCVFGSQIFVVVINDTCASQYVVPIFPKSGVELYFFLLRTLGKWHLKWSYINSRRRFSMMGPQILLVDKYFFLWSFHHIFISFFGKICTEWGRLKLDGYLTHHSYQMGVYQWDPSRNYWARKCIGWCELLSSSSLYSFPWVGGLVLLPSPKSIFFPRNFSITSKLFPSSLRSFINPIRPQKSSILALWILAWAPISTACILWVSRESFLIHDSFPSVKHFHQGTFLGTCIESAIKVTKGPFVHFKALAIQVPRGYPGV
ncbi:hypothetical protein VP01_99g2 [Puccinia sorghi]|uniref:Uncharacterized protein n=1 Tax=Puccinia sorghi TaxID=27349 RepID=A0A0L6U566_9BASI|nr:hypothetical protein VP01_99g2 [Puccinia sorghi]